MLLVPKPKPKTSLDTSIFSPNKFISAACSLTLVLGSIFIKFLTASALLKKLCILSASEGSGIPSTNFLEYVKFLVASVNLVPGTSNITSPTLPVLFVKTSLKVSPCLTSTLSTICFSLAATFPMRSTFILVFLAFCLVGVASSSKAIDSSATCVKLSSASRLLVCFVSSAFIAKAFLASSLPKLVLANINSPKPSLPTLSPFLGPFSLIASGLKLRSLITIESIASAYSALLIVLDLT